MVVIQAKILLRLRLIVYYFIIILDDFTIFALAH